MCLCLDTPRSRRLNTDSKSNILFYLTGHGGENFLKFQDDEEINAFELADAFEQMNQKKRYNELLFIGLETIFYSFEYFNFSRYMPGSVNYQISLLGRICWFCQFKSWRRFVIASCWSWAGLVNITNNTVYIIILILKACIWSIDILIIFWNSWNLSVQILQKNFLKSKKFVQHNNAYLHQVWYPFIFTLWNNNFSESVWIAETGTTFKCKSNRFLWIRTKNDSTDDKSHSKSNYERIQRRHSVKPSHQIAFCCRNNCIGRCNIFK